MPRTEAPDGSNVGTGTAMSDGGDIMPAAARDAVTVSESDVTTRPAEWMTRPPSNGRTYDYRLRGLDLGAQLVEDVHRPVHVKRASNRRARRRLLIQCGLVLAVTALVTVTLRALVAEPVSVNSTAMVPTLPSGSSVLVVKWSPLAGSTKTGDILVFREPSGSHCPSGGADSHRLIARVIGMPGQTIWSSSGRIFVDGKVLDEPGWYNPPFGEVGPTAIPRTTVPPGGYYVLGDNRTDTCDSRAFGPVARSLVVGKVVAIVLRNGHPFLHVL